MINLINTYVEMQKKLNEEHGIIGVLGGYNMPTVQVYEIDKFLEHGKGYEITAINRKGDYEFPYEAVFNRNNITFLIVLDKEEYEEIIKIEGVKHE